MWDLFELADGVRTIADVLYRISRGVVERTPGAVHRDDEHPGPAVPEPPPPRLPDTGWEEFAPQEKSFFP